MYITQGSIILSAIKACAIYQIKYIKETRSENDLNKKSKILNKLNK